MVTRPDHPVSQVVVTTTELAVEMVVIVCGALITGLVLGEVFYRHQFTKSIPPNLMGGLLLSLFIDDEGEVQWD